MKIVWKIVEGLSRENMDAMETIVGASLADALDNVIAQNNREQGRDKPCPYVTPTLPRSFTHPLIPS